jgi:ankyrin repeat protein
LRGAGHIFDAVYGRTLLMGAACADDEDMVRYLLRAGASVDLQASDGGTALHCAVAGGHPRVVRALLDAGADATVRTTAGETVQELVARETREAGDDAEWAGWLAAVQTELGK